jgi:cytidylate kinase
MFKSGKLDLFSKFKHRHLSKYSKNNQGDFILLGTWIKWLEIFEKDLLEKLAPKELPKSKLVIAIGGLSGVGKDTLANSLQRLFKENFGTHLNIIVAGQTLRQLARQDGFHESDLDEYMKKITTERLAEEVDRRIEQETLRKALTEEGDIFVGRMAPFTIGDWGFTFWLEADRNAIARRIVNDPNRAEFGMDEKEILKKLYKRDQTDSARLEEVYSIDIEEMIPKVNLILNTTHLDIIETAELAYSNTISHFKALNLV